MALNRREFVKQTAALGLTIGGGLYLSAPGKTEAARKDSPLRPPGALSEDAFTATCIRCMKCIDACPNRTLIPMPIDAGGGRGGTPTLHPRSAACMLCAGQDGDYLKCTEACPSGALQRVRREKEDVRRKVKIGVAIIDFDLCYSYNNWSCGACYRACPLPGAAMTVGLWERPSVNPDNCIGCGCCERSCIRYPHAIRVKSRSVRCD